jgi:PAS domain S-box-containing protein
MGALGDDAFRELADFAPVMIWRSNAQGDCDWVNRTWTEFTGRPLQAELGTGWAGAVHPDDRDRLLSGFEDAFKAHRPFTIEFRLRRNDHAFRWMLAKGAPFYRSGQFAGFWGSCTDITDHREAQRMQRLMIGELNHRAKNLLTVVQAIASQTFQEGRPLEDSLDRFCQRLRALAKAHDLLLGRGWEDVPVHRLVDAALAPHDPGDDRVVFDGPPLLLQADTALSLAMALHELFTNATKYGALSVADGHVRVRWRHCGDTGRMCLLWQELGGPAVTPPAERGFGTRFIERMLGDGEAGRAQLCFDRAGMRCTIEMPARPL